MEFPILYACNFVDDMFCYISRKYNLRKESPLGMSELKHVIPRTFTKYIAEIIEHEKYVNEAIYEARMFDFDWNVYLSAGCYGSYYLLAFCQHLLDFKPLGSYGILYASAFVSQLCIYCVLMDNQEALYNALCALIGAFLWESSRLTLKQWSVISVIAEYDLKELKGER